MEENKLGVVMLLSGIATVIFWVFYTSFTTYTQRMNFLFQAYINKLKLNLQILNANKLRLVRFHTRLKRTTCYL